MAVGLAQLVVAGAGLVHLGQVAAMAAVDSYFAEEVWKNPRERSVLLEGWAKDSPVFGLGHNRYSSDLNYSVFRPYLHDFRRLRFGQKSLY